jgi:hypothetical protein
MRRSSEVALRQLNADTARNIGTTTSTAAIRHAVENPLEAGCTICGHSPESHIPTEARYGYSPTNAATSTASAKRYVWRKVTMPFYRFCVTGRVT